MTTISREPYRLGLRVSAALFVASALAVAATGAEEAKKKPSGGKKPPVPALVAPDKQDRPGPRREAGPRFDQPAEAVQFNLLKRSPDGVSPIDPALYSKALRHMDGMPQYSTAEGRALPSRADMTSNPADLPALATWKWLGPGNVGGRTRALLIHPTTPSTMYAGGVAGGVWRSTNSGTSWAPLADLMANIAVSTLAFESGNPGVLYAGTGEGFFNGDATRGGGIFKSTDGGTSWAQIASTTTSDFYYVNKIVTSPVTASHVYAATRTGVWRSTDSGSNWTKVQAVSNVSDVGFTDLVIRTDQATDWLFAAEGSFYQGAIWRNTDASGAGTWTKVYTEANQGRASLALAPSAQDTVYALMSSIGAGNYQYGLLAVVASTTGGASASWSDRYRNTGTTALNNLLLTNPLYSSAACVGGTYYYNQGWYDNVIAVDPTNPNTVWSGGIDLLRSTDGGANWQIASYWWATPGVNSQYAHADNHVLVFHPQYNGSSNQTLYVGSDGGIFRTDNAASGTTATALCPGTFTNTLAWTILNGSYGVTQFYDGAVYPDGNTFFGGTQDNGTNRGTTAGGPNAWARITGGDGGYVAVDPTNTNNLFAEYTSISLQKSTNGGASFASAISGITESSNNFLFITPFTMDPSSSQNMWIGGAFPWRTVNGATNWSQAGGFMSWRTSAIAVAKTDSNRVLFGTQAGSVFRTTTALTNTGSSVWPSVSIAGAYISWLAFDPTNASIAYATITTFGVKHIWKSIDGGATWAFLDGTGPTSFPDIPAHSIVVDPSDTSRLYVGSDLGVFTSTDGGANWNVENSGFANVPTESLKIVGGNLYAFTHGRGAYRVTLCSNAAAVTSVTPPSGTNPFTGSSVSWTASNATGYDVYFDTVNPPQKMVATGTAALSVPTPTWFPSTTYYWRVLAHGACADALSSVASLTTGACPWAGTAPVLVLPANGAGSQPLYTTLGWNAVAGTSHYDVYLGTTNPPTVRYQAVYDPGISLSVALAPGQTYYWQVKAVPVCGTGSATASPVQSFTTATNSFTLTGVSPTSLGRWTSTPFSVTGTGFLGTTLPFTALGGTGGGSYTPGTTSATLISGTLGATNSPAGIYDVGIANSGVEVARLTKSLVVKAFTDVDQTVFFFESSSRVSDAGLMEADFDAGTPWPQFVPTTVVTRALMAEYLAKAYQWQRTRSTALPAATCTPSGGGSTDFPDVSCSHPDWLAIHWIKTWGITAGAACVPGPGICYLPDASITRGQMATFLTRLKYGPEGTGTVLQGFLDGFGANDPGCLVAYPACSGWTDPQLQVPPATWPHSYVNVAYQDRLTNGCSGTVPPFGFCTGSLITRGQMAEFLGRTVGLVPTP